MYLPNEVIYGVFDGEGCLRYVGRTRKPLHERFASHRGGRTPISWIIRENVTGATIRVLEEVPLVRGGPFRMLAGIREYRWIRNMRKRGVNLVNVLPRPVIYEQPKGDAS